MHEDGFEGTLDGFEGGLQLGGRRVTNLRYADDIVLIACSASDGTANAIGRNRQGM